MTKRLPAALQFVSQRALPSCSTAFSLHIGRSALALVRLGLRAAVKCLFELLQVLQTPHESVQLTGLLRCASPSLAYMVEQVAPRQIEVDRPVSGSPTTQIACERKISIPVTEASLPSEDRLHALYQLTKRRWLRLYCLSAHHKLLPKHPLLEVTSSVRRACDGWCLA